MLGDIKGKVKYMPEFDKSVLIFIRKVGNG